MAPRTGWICDTCHKLINTPKDGYVQWVSVQSPDGKYRGRGLQLVHHYPVSPLKGKREHGCQYVPDAEFKKDRGIIADLPLEDFVGPDGLMDLLSMVSEEKVPKEEGLEMIKRIHIPGYEHARGYFERAISEGVFEPNTQPGYYSVRDINRVLAWLDKEGL